MRTPFFYNRVLQKPDAYCSYNDAWGQAFAAGDLCYEQKGHETHMGAEFYAEGRANRWLRLSASAVASTATSQDTGTAAYDNKQIINAPRLRTSFFADLELPHTSGLHVMPGWNFAGRKSAAFDDSVSVSSASIFNIGARYTVGGDKGHTTVRLYADNIFDKRYWKDTGANYGDAFLHVGAPTTVRLSAHYTF